MPSCISEKPGPEEVVSARIPQAAAPKAMFMPATSDSVWMNWPPTSFMRQDIYSSISLCGVMG